MSSNEEQSFTIQPHPAKTNDPADLQGNVQSGGANAFTAKPGPQILSEEQLSSLPEPESKEDLAKRAEELNK